MMGPDESGRRLRPMYSSEEPQDQVVRLEQFRDAHPGVTVVYVRTAHGGYWIGDGIDAAGAIRRIVEYDLRLLLDQLNRAFGPGDSAGATGKTQD